MVSLDSVSNGLERHIHQLEWFNDRVTKQFPFVVLIRYIDIKLCITQKKFVLRDDHMICQILVPHLIFISVFCYKLHSWRDCHPEFIAAVLVK